MTFDLKAQLLVDLGNWQAGLTKASKQMTGFGKSMKTISNGVKAGFAGIALMGIASVYDGLVEMTKAASMDTKSVALLNKQMSNSWHATDKTKKSVDNYINSVSNMTGILDDNLRPAFSKIIRVTNGQKKATQAFNMALNISAGTGKDLNTVSAAYAKFLGGNKLALERLVPGLKNAGDKMGFLNTQFAGMAKLSGANDPFARINAVMDNFKEKLGTAFLPLVNSFADWLAGPDAQGMMDSVAKWVQDTMGWFTSPEGQKQLKDWYEKAKSLAEQMVRIIEGVSVFFGAAPTGFKENPNFTPNDYTKLIKPGDTSLQKFVPNTSTVNNYYTINGVVSGNDVVKALRGQATQKGRTILGLLSQ
jgi:hypothetical protein